MVRSYGTLQAFIWRTCLRLSLCKVATSLKQLASLAPNSTKTLQFTSVEQPSLYKGELELAHRWMSETSLPYIIRLVHHLYVHMSVIQRHLSIPDAFGTDGMGPKCLCQCPYLGILYTLHNIPKYNLEEENIKQPWLAVSTSKGSKRSRTL